MILDLQPGENRLLLKIYNQSGSHGFYFALGPSQAMPAPQSAREFPVLRGVPCTREAIEDLLATYGDKYPKAACSLAAWRNWKRASKRPTRPWPAKTRRQERIAELAEKFAVFARDALLANPLLAFDKLLLVKRGAGNLGLPPNWQANCSIGRRAMTTRLPSSRPSVQREN